MRLIIRNRALKRRRAELARIGAEALAAARLGSVMQGKVVLVPVGRGSGEAGSRHSRMGTVCDARVGYVGDGTRLFPHTQYFSYLLKRIPPFIVHDLTPVQRWALTLVHEAQHVAQWHKRQRISEVQADRSVLKAQQALGWGRLEYV